MVSTDLKNLWSSTFQTLKSTANNELASIMIKEEMSKILQPLIVKKQNMLLPEPTFYNQILKFIVHNLGLTDPKTVLTGCLVMGVGLVSYKILKKLNHSKSVIEEVTRILHIYKLELRSYTA